jgi:putative proteasome-type protease
MTYCIGVMLDAGLFYERDRLALRLRRRFVDGDDYFTALSREWSEGTREVFRKLPEVRW